MFKMKGNKGWFGKNKCCCKNEKGFQHQNGKGCHHQHRHNCIMLSECNEDDKVRIRSNPDIKTMEMGVFPGRNLTIVKNSDSDDNIIVALDDARLIIAKKIAENIMVKAHSRCS